RLGLRGRDDPHADPLPCRPGAASGAPACPVGPPHVGAGGGASPPLARDPRRPQPVPHSGLLLPLARRPAAAGGARDAASSDRRGPTPPGADPARDARALAASLPPAARALRARALARGPRGGLRGAPQDRHPSRRQRLPRTPPRQRRDRPLPHHPGSAHQCRPPRLRASFLRCAGGERGRDPTRHRGRRHRNPVPGRSGSVRHRSHRNRRACTGARRYARDLLRPRNPPPHPPAHGGRADARRRGGAGRDVRDVPCPRAPGTGPGDRRLMGDARLTSTPARECEESDSRRTGRTRPLVLVVEDNQGMSSLLVDMLAPDYDVTTAVNGRDGLEKARSLHPDLVLTDVMMPEMTGDELVRALRADDQLAGTAILVLTAKLDQDLRVQLLRQGAQDYVLKPFSVEELRARVGNVVTTKRARDVLQQTLASQSHDLAALAEMLSERQEDLAAAHRAKDEFLATLSHELRTPVTGMLAWLWMLRRGHLDQAAAARAYETMEGSIRSLVRIIDDLLDVSRIIRGQLRLEVHPISLVPVVQAAIDAVRPAADAKQIELEAVLDPEAGPVHGDAARFQQVVRNLLMNSIKFTPAGGRVSVRLASRGTEVQVTVRDTGIGIPREFLPHVFERFRQADGGTTREHGGLGLGLAIVRHLVELHGGTVT